MKQLTIAINMMIEMGMCCMRMISCAPYSDVFSISEFEHCAAW